MQSSQRSFKAAVIRDHREFPGGNALVDLDKLLLAQVAGGFSITKMFDKSVHASAAGLFGGPSGSGKTMG